MNAKKTAKDSLTSDAPSAFPIVAIGASAGGLEAITQLLKHLPAQTGMAFVIVQHLDPVRDSMLTDILKRATEMPVSEISDGLHVIPNHVFIIPPGCYLGILHGELQLLPYPDKTHRHSPIDHFMQTLADDQGSKAIGIVLSGTGSDGSLGLKAIKIANGITFAQDEASAAYSGMPSSAISAGVVDRVLPPDEIARELVQIGHYPNKQYLDLSAATVIPELDDAFNKILILLRSRSGHDFAHYKQTTIKRRIKRRMVLQKLENLKDYVKLLQSSKTEVDALFQDILINVTGFFRDPESFEALRQLVFPELIRNHRTDTPIRIWIPGCSTGEEAYSVAMTLLEYMSDMSITIPIQIFASDIDDQAIEKARKGIYPEKIIEQVAAPRLKRFFVKVSGGYQISKAIRDLCIFAEQNVTKDPPFSRLDLICCRNLLIYFGPVLQRKVFQLFHYALHPSGYLFLGNSESIGSYADLFALMDKKHRLYSKKSVAVRPNYDFTARPSFPDVAVTHDSSKDSVVTIRALQNEAEQLVMNRYGPPGVIINEHLDILHFRGDTSAYISPIPGVASLNLLKMARQDLVIELRSLVTEAIKKDEAVQRQGVSIRHNGQHHLINLQVVPLAGSLGNERCLLVLIEPQPQVVAPAASGKKKAQADSQDKHYAELERELISSREYLQSIIEDQEASNEELKSANEEIQSANEELQSTNEELETAKEELQSTNEELATVNDELESRNRELGDANNDLANLLISINQPIVILSADLKIRRFTPCAKTILNLIDTDIGRPIGNLRPNIEVQDLESICLDVIEHMSPYSSEVRDRDGRWHSMRIRPYVTEDKRIDGVLLTLIDITDMKQAEQLRGSLVEKERLATVVRDSNDAITAVALAGEIMAWNPGAERLYGYAESEVLGENIAILIPKTEQKNIQQMLGAVSAGKSWPPFESVRLTKNGEAIKVWITASALVDAQGKVYAVSTTERVINDQPPTVD